MPLLLRSPRRSHHHVDPDPVDAMCPAVSPSVALAVSATLMLR